MILSLRGSPLSGWPAGIARGALSPLCQLPSVPLGRLHALVLITGAGSS